MRVLAYQAVRMGIREMTGTNIILQCPEYSTSVAALQHETQQLQCCNVFHPDRGLMP
jgi:hypothetical protein